MRMARRRSGPDSSDNTSVVTSGVEKEEGTFTETQHSPHKRGHFILRFCRGYQTYLKGVRRFNDNKNANGNYLADFFYA